MNKVKRNSIVLSLTIFLTACGAWTKINNSTVVAGDNTFSVELPTTWMRLVVDESKVTATRDGLGIQMIEVSRSKNDKAFENTKKTAKPGMLASELAELTIAEAKAEKATENLKVLSSTPANISGNNGFRVHYSFKNSKGLRYERVVYGFSDSKNFYTLIYQAPSLNFFNKYLSTFKTSVDSFRAKT